MRLRDFQDIAKKNGAKILLTIGEDGSKSSLPMRRVLRRFLRHNKFRYSQGQGDPSLLEAIVKKENLSRSQKIKSENVLLTHGSTEAIYLSFAYLQNKKGEVLLFTPIYPLYRDLCLHFHIPYRLIDLQNENFEITVSRLQKEINENTLAVLINTPQNPTGKIIPQSVVEALEFLQLHFSFYLFYDLCYESLCYQPHPSISMGPRTVKIKSLSKAYRMTGLRVGYLLGDPEVIKWCKHVHEMMLVSLSPIIQMGAKACIEKQKPFSYTKQKKFVIQALRRFPIDFIEPEGGFYVWIDIRRYHLSSYDFCMFLAKQTGVCLLPGSYFQQEGYVRLSFCSSLKVLKKAFRLLASFFIKGEDLLEEV